MDNYYKSKRAFETLSKLPQFVTRKTDSSFFGLINTYNIELDKLNKDIVSSALNVVPSTFNTSLPSSVYSTTVLSETEIVASGFVEKSLYDFSYSNPTSFSNSIYADKITEYKYVDTHFVSPFYYENSEGTTVKLDEALVALRDEDSWFDQKIDIIDINKVLNGNIIKNGNFSDYGESTSFPTWSNWQADTSAAAVIEWTHSTAERAPKAKVISYGANAISYGSRFLQYLDFADYKAGETYRFSCEIKTDKSTAFEHRNWFNVRGWNTHDPISDTTFTIGDDWTRCEFDIVIPEEQSVTPYLVIEFTHGLHENAYSHNNTISTWVRNVISTKIVNDEQIGHHFLVHSQDLPVLYQTLESSPEDEWVTLDLENKFSPKEAFFTNLKIIDAYSQTTLTKDIHYAFTNVEETEIVVYAPFSQNELVVEYEYAPCPKLKAFSYLKEYHSVLRNSAGALDIFYLTPEKATTYTRLLRHEKEIAVIKGQEIAEGTSLSGTISFNKTMQFIYDSMNVGTHNYTGVYLQSVTPGIPVDNLNTQTVTLYDPAGEVPPLNVPNYEDNPQALVYYVVTPSNTNYSIKIISINTLYTNFGIKINFSKGLVITDEISVDTGSTYEQEGATYKYLTIPSILAEKDWYWADETSLSSNLLNTAEMAIHNSISSQSLPIHLEEEYFLNNPIFSLTEDNMLETYSLSGELQNRVPLNSDYVYIALRRYADSLVLLGHNPEGITYVLLYYNVNTLEQEDVITLDSNGVDGSSLHSFSINDEGNLYLFSNRYNGLSVREHKPYYGYYTVVEDLASSKTIWFREDPNEYTTVEYVTENVLDHWGRVLGAERWPLENLKDYSLRLSNIAASGSGASKQGIINGISAMLNVNPYNVNEKTVYSLTHKLEEVNRDFEVTISETDPTSSSITIQALVESIDSITFDPALPEDITDLSLSENVLTWTTSETQETTYTLKYLPKAEALGEELVTNGGFTAWTADDPDGWTVTTEYTNTKITQNGNACRLLSDPSDANNGFIAVKQTILTAGKTYKVSINVTENNSVGGGDIRIQDNNFTTSFIIANISTVGVHTAYFTSDIGGYFRIIRDTSSPDGIDITFTDVSVKEVLTDSTVMFTTGTPGLVQLTEPTQNQTVGYWTRNSNIDSIYYNDFMYFEEDIEIEQKELPTEKQVKIKTVKDVIELTDKRYDISSTYKTAVNEASRHLQYKWDSFQWDRYKWEDGARIKSGIPTVFDGVTYKTGVCSDTSLLNQSDCILANETWISFDGGEQETNDQHSIQFVASDDTLLEIASLPFNTANEQWNSVAWWQKLASNEGSSEMPISMYGNAPNVYTQVEGDQYKIGYNTGNSDIFGIEEPKSNWENKWKHCTLSWKVNSNSNDTSINDTDVKFWVDGVEKNLTYVLGTNSNACNTSSVSSVGIGGMTGSSNYKFNGLISDVSFYSALLTTAEVNDIMNVGSNKMLLSTSSSLLAWYKMGDGPLDSNTVVTDITDDSFGTAIFTENFEDNNASGWGWTGNNEVTIEGEAAVLQVNGNGEFVYINTGVAYISDTVYKVTFDAKSTLDGYIVRVSDHNNELGGVGSTDSKGEVTVGTEWAPYSLLWKTTSDSNVIQFSRHDTSQTSLTFSISNIVVEPLNGSPAVLEGASDYTISPYYSDFPIPSGEKQFGFKAGAFSKALTIYDNTDTLKVNSGYFCIEDKEFYLYPTTPDQEILLDADDDGQVLKDYPAGTDPIIAKLFEASVLVGHGGSDELNRIAGGCIVGTRGFTAATPIRQYTDASVVFTAGAGSTSSSAFTSDPLFMEGSHELLEVTVNSVTQPSSVSMTIADTGIVYITGAVDGNGAFVGSSTLSVTVSYKYSIGDYITYTTTEECTEHGICIDTSRSTYIENALIDEDFENSITIDVNGELQTVDNFIRLGDINRTYSNIEDFMIGDTLPAATYNASIPGNWYISVSSVSYDGNLLYEGVDYTVNSSGDVDFITAQIGGTISINYITTSTFLRVSSNNPLDGSKDLLITTTEAPGNIGGIMHNVGVEVVEGQTYKLSFNYKIVVSATTSSVYYKWGTLNTNTLSPIVAGTITQTLADGDGVQLSTSSEVTALESGIIYLMIFDSTGNKMSLQVDNIHFQRIADVIAEGITDDECTIYENSTDILTDWIPYQWVTPSINLLETMDGPNLKQIYEATSTKYGYLRQVHNLNNYSTYTGEDSDILDIINNTDVSTDDHHYYIDNNDDTNPTLHSSVLTKNVLVTYGVEESKVYDTEMLLDNTINLSNKVLGVAGFKETINTLKLYSDKPFYTSSDSKLAISAEVMGSKNEYIAGVTVNINNKDYLTNIDGRVTAIIDISNYGTADKTITVTASMNDVTITNTITIKNLGDL